MSTQLRESGRSRADAEPRKVQLWQIAVVGAGFLLLVAHPVLGTRLPLPGGGLVAGLLLPALLFLAPFLRAGKRSGAREAVETVSPDPVRAAPSADSGPEPAPSAGPAPGAPQIAADLRGAHRRHVEQRSMRTDRMRLVVYVLVPLAAIASLAAVGVFGSVVCFAVGAIALILIERAESA